MIFAQLSHAIGPNDGYDWLRLKSGVLALFGVTPPSKNGLSNATRDDTYESAVANPYEACCGPRFRNPAPIRVIRI
ncbi:MAG: hypothetical protein J0M04_19775 [Verrucomicrobia bacterium]|nr:hypothetical protein [Verrucomicrobiota bacterium]